MSEAQNDKSLELFSHTPVVLEDFHLAINGRCLLDKVNIEFEAGKLIVIVGASGSGKSTLLRILAGLIDEGDKAIEFQGKITTAKNGVAAKVGLVFQNFALLDEFSPKDNVKLALDHSDIRVNFESTSALRSNSTDAKNKNSAHDKSTNRDLSRRFYTPQQWLDLLHVPTDRAVSKLSGGQKQRLAIARTLAAHPDILLYDEPTSGLDAWAARNVAELIRDTQSRFGITSIVVTHDYASWLEVADYVFILDQSARNLVGLENRSPESVIGKIDAGVKQLTPTDPSLVVGTANHQPKWQEVVGNCLEWIGRLGLSLLTIPWNILPRWKNWFWGTRFLAHYLSLVAGYSAWFYLAIAGLITGFVSTYFTFRYLPYEIYTKPLLMEELLSTIGFALYRVLVPVLATILVAARCGAAVSADIGGKKYGGQIDALKTLDVAPAQYLYTPILIAFLVGTPLLTEVAFLVAKIASLIVFASTHPQLGPDYWDFHFHRRISSNTSIFYVGFNWLMTKTLLCGVLVGWVAYLCGNFSKSSSRDVSRSITSTVLWATLAVLIVHFLIAFWEFDSSR
jgi:ABC-type sugar transport system ATPase subunit/ABC-type transporter Mla maintaining outer membrane lipid asymmetry permease subunit MlaE